MTFDAATDVVDLGDGLFSIQVPLPIPSPAFVFAYCFTTDDGLYLIDTGWDTEEGWDALVRGIETIGYRVADVKGVAVTHFHLDHLGLGARLREMSGCWIGMHPADIANVASPMEPRTSGPDAQSERMLRAGAPAADVEALRTTMATFPRPPEMAVPDREINDHDRLDFPGWDVQALWTPGHTPGHLCFVLPDRGSVLTGDHILPRITPNITVDLDRDEDPLSEYLESLALVRDLGYERALPAHEYRFSTLTKRADDISNHHDARFAEIRAAVAAGERTTYQIASCMTWSRDWSRLGGMTMRMALSEAEAHLRTLERRGVLRRTTEDVDIWELTEDGKDVTTPTR